MAPLRMAWRRMNTEKKRRRAVDILASGKVLSFSKKKGCGMYEIKIKHACGFARKKNMFYQTVNWYTEQFYAKKMFQNNFYKKFIATKTKMNSFPTQTAETNLDALNAKKYGEISVLAAFVGLPGWFLQRP